MPKFDLQGEVFTLDAGAGFDAGIVSTKVGADARMNFATRFELCHGLSTELSSAAIATAAADLGLLWALAGAAEGEASAAAGVRLDAQATIDLFDRFGLSADLAAFAEASLAGRLAIGLDLSDIALAARGLIPGNEAYNAFLAFLRETRIEAGVWGKISCAAMAKAHLNIRGSLADDEGAGFVIEHGIEGGLLAGAGYDFYAGVRLDNPKRFFLNAADILTSAIIQQARPLVPKTLGPQLTALEFILPTSLATAYELGQLTSMNAAAEAGNVLVGCSLSELQRFTLDKVGLAAMTVVSNMLDELAPRIPSTGLTSSRRTTITGACQAAIAVLRGEGLTFTAVQDTIPGLVDIFDGLVPDARDTWRPLLAASWLAFAAAEAVRQGIKSAEASASAGVVGLQTQVAEAFLVSLPDTPDIVREELEPLLGTVPDSLEFGAVVDYLMQSRVCPLLESLVPDLYALMELVSRHTGIKASSLVEVSLRATAGDDLTATQLYRAFRNIATTALDDLVLETLLPSLGDLLPEGTDSQIWLGEVAEPALTMMSGFALSRIDDLVAGRIPFGEQTMDTLRAGLSLMIGKIVLQNVVVLTDILLDHITDSLSEAAAGLSRTVREEGGPLATTAQTLMETLLPSWLPKPPGLAAASQKLAAELLLALSESTSDEIFTEQRRATNRALIRRILFSVYGEADRVSSDSLKGFIAQVAACAYLPSPESLQGLVSVQMDTMTDQLAISLPRIDAALQDFFLTIGDGSRQAFEAAVGEWLAERRNDIVDWGNELVALGRELEELNRLISDLAKQIDQLLSDLAGALRRGPRRTEILDALQAFGAEVAVLNARSTPGYDLLPVETRQATREAAVATFNGLFVLVRPLLDGALHVLAEVADMLSNLFDGASDLAALNADLAHAITEKVGEAVQALTGLELPPELSVDDVARIAAQTITGLPVVRNSLSAAYGLRADRTQKQEDQKIKALEEAKKEALKKAATERLEEAERRGPASVTICSPQPVSNTLDDVWAYGDNVPVRVTVSHAASSGAAGAEVAPMGCLVALNGDPLKLPAGAWTREPSGRWLLLHTLTTNNSALRPGANVLECSVANGIDPTAKVTTLFLMHRSPSSDGVTTSDGNGHLNIQAGKVPVDIDGWAAYHSHNGRSPLRGVVPKNGQLTLPTLTFTAPSRLARRPGSPQPPVATPGGRLPTDSTACEPTISIVDERHRWRGDFKQ